MALTRHVISPLTDASGDATAYGEYPLAGYVHAIRYIADGVAPFASTVDITITGETSGVPVLTVTNQSGSATWYPRAATVSTANAAALYAASGTAVNDRIALAGERLKVVVAQGGAAKTGALHILVES